MTPAYPAKDQLDRLRHHMPDLSMDNDPPGHDDARAAYLHAYGLNFAEHQDRVLYRGGRLSSSQTPISCQLWQQKEETGKGTVVLVHGLYDHSGLYGHLIRFFLQHGYCVFAYDQPGHGLSGGAPANIDSFASYAQVLRLCLDWCLEAQLPQPFHLVGQSMGGAVITELLRQHDAAAFPLHSLTLLAPLIRPRAWRWGRIQYLLARHFLRRIPRRHSSSSHDSQFLAFLRGDPLQATSLPVSWIGAMHRWIKTIEKRNALSSLPVFVIQGLQDGTVDWKHNMAVYQRLYPNARMLQIPQARHNLANESTSIREQFMPWLAERLESADEENPAILARHQAP